MELQRSNRPRQRPFYLKDFVGVAKTHELMNFDEVVQDPSWIIITKKEMTSIDKKNTWTLVDCPKGKSFILAKHGFIKSRKVQEKLTLSRQGLSHSILSKGLKLTTKKCIF